LVSGSVAARCRAALAAIIEPFCARLNPVG
jgi:hypothetical protein